MKKEYALRLYTNRDGIEAVFKLWQNETVNILLEANEEHSSNEMHTRLRARDHDISRASVINFLNGLSKANLVTKREESAKGGYKGIYQITDSRHWFDDKVVKIFCLKMFEAFPTIEWLKDIWEEEHA